MTLTPEQVEKKIAEVREQVAARKERQPYSYQVSTRVTEHDGQRLEALAARAGVLPMTFARALIEAALDSAES